jgi:hypothetical protein
VAAHPYVYFLMSHLLDYHKTVLKTL